MANKNRWFKHYNNAHDSDGFKNAWAAGDHTSIALYWLFLELISNHEDRDNRPGYCSMHERFLCRVMGTNIRGLKTFFANFNNFFGESLVIVWSKFPTNMVETWSKHGRNFRETFPEVSDEFVQFFAPKWLELQESRGGKRETKLKQSEHQKMTDPRSKKKEIRHKSEFDFELVYQSYPRKQGKAEAMARLPKIIKTQEDFDDFYRAVVNYANEQDRLKTEMRHIKHFSSFVGTESVQPWRDWVDFEPEFQLAAPGRKIINIAGLL